MALALGGPDVMAGERPRSLTSEGMEGGHLKPAGLPLAVAINSGSITYL